MVLVGSSLSVAALTARAVPVRGAGGTADKGEAASAEADAPLTVKERIVARVLRQS